MDLIPDNALRVPDNEAGAAALCVRLRDELRHANDAYYVHDAPIMSDAAYDERLDLLGEVERRYPALALADSPTQRVGAERIGSGFRAVPHAVPMLSLSKVHGLEGVREWSSRLHERLTRTVCDAADFAKLREAVRPMRAAHRFPLRGWLDSIAIAVELPGHISLAWAADMRRQGIHPEVAMRKLSGAWLVDIREQARKERGVSP